MITETRRWWHRGTLENAKTTAIWHQIPFPTLTWPQLLGEWASQRACWLSSAWAGYVGTLSWPAGNREITSKATMTPSRSSLWKSSCNGQGGGGRHCLGGGLTCLMQVWVGEKVGLWLPTDPFLGQHGTAGHRHGFEPHLSKGQQIFSCPSCWGGSRVQLGPVTTRLEAGPGSRWLFW